MPLDTALNLTATIALAVVSLAAYKLAKTELFVTLVHEAGHAATSIATGGGFDWIRIHHDTSGQTSIYATSSLRAGITAAAGYLTPGLAGLATAWAATNNHTTGALYVITAVTAVVMWFGAGIHTKAVAIVFGLAAGLAAFKGGDTIQAVVATATAWTLLLGGVWDSVGSWFHGTDAAAVQAHTGIPRPLVVLVTVATQLWCLWIGARLLIGAV